MRITIEIDGVEVASQTAPSTGAAREIQAPEAQGPTGAGLEEVYARAAAMGAIDAGPAPAAEDMARGGVGGEAATAAPQMYVGGGMATAADQSAGAAPQLDLQQPDNP